MLETLRTLTLCALLGAASLLASCTGDPEFCRYDPECGGGIGSNCRTSDDCSDGFCCDSGNCGGGMCTYRCDADRDCPVEMACEHGTCFFTCSSDDDCAPGMSCEHGDTVCEWM